MMCSTDAKEWQESERYGASVLQEAPRNPGVVLRGITQPGQ